MVFKQFMQEKEDLRLYEQVLVLRPESSEQEHKELCALIARIIEGAKGKIFRVDTWGSRPIANPKAKKASRGWYFYMLFSAPGQVVAEIRRQLSIHKKILYFHQERLDKKETAESHIKKFFHGLEQTAQREKERQAKIHKRQNFASRA